MDIAQIWFILVAFFFVGYFILDGFDFGVGMALPLRQPRQHRPPRHHQHHRPRLGPQRDLGHRGRGSALRRLP